MSDHHDPHAGPHSGQGAVPSPANHKESRTEVMGVSKPGKPGLITGAADDSGAGAGFEAVLAAAAYDGIGGLAPPADLSRLARAVLRNPVRPARSLAGLALRLGAIGWGSAAAGPAGEGLDRRFADPAWTDNPLLNRIAFELPRLLRHDPGHA